MRDSRGRPGELKFKKIDTRQIACIQPKLDVTTSPLIAQEIHQSYKAGECSAEQVTVQMIDVQVTTGRYLMQKTPESRNNRGPPTSREQVRISRLTGKPRRPFWRCTRDLANFR